MRAGGEKGNMKDREAIPGAWKGGSVRAHKLPHPSFRSRKSTRISLEQSGRAVSWALAAAVDRDLVILRICDSGEDEKAEY